MASTLTLRQVIDPLRAIPEVHPYTSVGGFLNEPALTFANDVMQRFLQEGMSWKWNRAMLPAFLTISVQQDYVTNSTNVGWMESGRRLDINNTSTPKPFQALEAVRDLGQSSYQGTPFQVCAIPNTLATMGTWQALTAYGSGYGQSTTPVCPITQFIDANDNILFINSSSLDLRIDSDGYSGTPISTTPPFGTSGASEPAAALDAAAGTTVVDGTVTWTVGDPDGYAMRVVPIPAYAGMVWLMELVYQKKPPLLTSLDSSISPIPDELTGLFRAGFLAKCRDMAPGSTRANINFIQWEAAITAALRSGDREMEQESMYPTHSIMGGGVATGLPIGPAYPFYPGGGIY